MQIVYFIIGFAVVFCLYAVGEQIVDTIREKIHIAQEPRKTAETEKYYKEYYARLEADKEERERKKKVE